MKLNKPEIVHERRILFMALIAGLPAVITSHDHPVVDRRFGRRGRKPALLRQSAVDANGADPGVWLGFCFALRERVASPLRTLSNLLAAMREGDYSIRARGGANDDAMGEVMQQVNAMSATLRAQRLGALEATTLLRKVMEEIDVAVFAFDGDHRVRLVNRAGGAAAGRARRTAAGTPRPIRSAWRNIWKANRSRPCSIIFPAAWRAGASGAARSARAGCRTSSWWSRT